MRTDQLPQSFLMDMQELLGEDYPNYLKAAAGKPVSGLRLNTRKTDSSFIPDHYPSLKRIPWVENGFYINEESPYTKNPYYYAGLYYIQEPSAMTPASLLGTTPGERILDLCAAPGGKSTEIGAALKDEGVLYANDLSASRAKALLKNLELFGIGNLYVTCEDSGALSAAFPQYFDRILIDAPCSGEGMFRKHPSVIRAYLEHGRDFYCPVQKILLQDAASMLKDGGTIVYSTCTYNRNEDENQIMEFLSSHPDFTLDPIPLKEGFTASRLLPGTVRLFPHRAEAEGHFAARLKKNGSSTEAGYAENAVRFFQADRKKREPLPEDLKNFLKKIRRSFDEKRFYFRNDAVFYLPENSEPDKKLRYLRTGLLFGQLVNGRFKPSQALAMNLKAEEWEDPVLLPKGSEDAIRYLKGETLNAESEGKGYRLLCYENYPLGFVKQDRLRLKNAYLPGWRWE